MIKKYYILVLTFLCLFLGQVSYGQGNGDYYGDEDDEIEDKIYTLEDAENACDCHIVSSQTDENGNVINYTDEHGEHRNGYVAYNSGSDTHNESNDGNSSSNDGNSNSNDGNSNSNDASNLDDTCYSCDCDPFFCTGGDPANDPTLDICDLFPSYCDGSDDTNDPCDPSSSAYDLCICNPESCASDTTGGGGTEPPCNITSCPTGYELVDCECIKSSVPWYLDNDGDGWHDATIAIITQEESPGTGWIKTTKGIDCADNIYSLENICSPCTKKLVCGTGFVLKNCECVAIPKAPDDPCKQLKTLTNSDVPANDPIGSNNNLLTANINMLKDKLTNFPIPFTGLFYERSVEVKKNNLDFYSTKENEIGNNFSAPVYTAPYIIGSIHNHPTNGVALPSIIDLRLLLNTYDSVDPNNRDEVFVMVVSKESNGNLAVYNLKINDIDKLRAGIKAVWDNPEILKITDEKLKIEAIKYAEAQYYLKAGNDEEKAFLQRHGGLGLDLYKSSNTAMDDWGKLTLTNDPVTNELKVTKSNCN